MRQPFIRVLIRRAQFVVAMLASAAATALAQQPDSSAKARASANAPALLRPVRVTPNPSWKCEAEPALLPSHGVDVVICDTRFRAAAIRAALIEHQSLGASDVCARDVADQLERAVSSWAAADTATALRTERVSCAGHVLTSDSLRYDDRAVLRVCPGRIWTWVERGSVSCDAIRSAMIETSSAGAAPVPHSTSERKALSEARAARDWFLENDFTKARTHAERAVALDSACAPGHAILGASQSMLGDYSSGALHLRRATALDPTNDWAWGMLAQTLYFDGADTALTTAANDALAANGNNSEVLGYLGMSQLRMSAVDSGVATLTRAVTLAPDDARFRAALARGHRLAGRNSDAERDARNAIRIAPKYYEGYAELGRVLEAEGRTSDAVTAYRTAHQLADWNSEITARLSALGAKP